MVNKFMKKKYKLIGLLDKNLLKLVKHNDFTLNQESHFSIEKFEYGIYLFF